MQLGVGLLEKGRPELLLGVGLHEDKLPIPEIVGHHYNLRKFDVVDDCFSRKEPCWKAVINDDINPLAILPESDGEKRIGRMHKRQYWCVLSCALITLISQNYGIYLLSLCYHSLTESGRCQHTSR